MSNNWGQQCSRKDHLSETKNSSMIHRSLSTNWQKILVILVVAGVVRSVPVARAAAIVGSRTTTKPILAPYVQCSSSVCDLRTHYCDEVIDACARCDDDCHPARISNVPSAISECQKKCQWYYVFKSTVAPSAMPSTLSQPSVGAVVQLKPEHPSEQGDTTVMLTVVISMAVITILALLAAIIIPAVVCHLYRHKTGISRIATDSSLNDGSKVKSAMVTNQTSELHTSTILKSAETRTGTDGSMSPSAAFSTNSDRIATDSFTPLLSSGMGSRTSHNASHA